MKKRIRNDEICIRSGLNLTAEIHRDGVVMDRFEIAAGDTPTYRRIPWRTILVIRLGMDVVCEFPYGSVLRERRTSQAPEPDSPCRLSTRMLPLTAAKTMLKGGSTGRCSPQENDPLRKRPRVRTAATQEGTLLMSNETIITFLGQQTRNGTNGNTIVRLADLHPETHELKPFHQNLHAPRIFANRSFFTAPPETPDVTFGIWTAVLIPHRQPGRDYTKSFSYVPYLTPTRILDFHVSRSSIASILSSPYFHDLLDTIVIKGGCSLVFHYHTQGHSNEALYIDRSIVEPWNGSARIKPDTITLPVIHLDSKQLNIQPTKLSPRYNFLPYPGMPQEEHFLTIMPIVPLQEAVKVYLTKHVLTWRDFQKKYADVTHNDHSVYRAILDAVQGMEMRGDLQSLYGCSDKQFDAACEGVLHSARDLLFLNDVPDKALMMLVNQDKEFVHKIEERLSQGWIMKHGDMMEKARQALAEAHAAREDVLAKVRKDEESLQRTESLIQDTEARRTSLEDDITRLEQARAEAERDLAAKIKAAQEAAAMAAEQARIAKRNMPRQETVRVVPVPASDPSSGASQTVSRFPPSVRAEDPEEISDAEGALEILEENLQTAGMSANAARDFARLAYGAYREKIPLCSQVPARSTVPTPSP